MQAGMIEERDQHRLAFGEAGEAREAGSLIEDSQIMRLGDAAGEIASAPHHLEGKLVEGGQDHFYLEGHISFAIPGEDGEVLLHCSTQHPSEVQHNIANVLGRPANAVTVEVRRMGGGFGGKETQAMQWAALAAIVATKTGRPAKFRLDRDDDMVITGNPEKTVSWMGQILRACRDQLERDEFTFPLAARWSKYKPKRGADADGRMPGLGLPASVLKQIYEIPPAKLLGAPPAPATP